MKPGFTKPFTRPFTTPFTRALTAPSTGGGAGFVPDAAFFAGAPGGAWDYSDTSKIFTGSGGTGAISASLSPIGYCADLSGNGNHDIQATAAERPLYLSHSWFSGAVYDGSASQTATGAIDFSGTSVITVVIGMVSESNKASGVIVELGPSAAATNGTFYTVLSNTNAARNFGFALRGTTVGALEGSTYQAPTATDVLCEYDIAGASQALRIIPTVGGVTPTLGTSATGNSAAAFASGQALNTGSRANGTLPAKMKLARKIVIGRRLTADEKTAARAWVTAPILTPPTPKVFVIGDSTIAGYLGYISVSNCIPTIFANDLAHPGDSIASQTTKWNSVAAYAGFGAIVLQVGLNDLDPAEAASVAIARLQTLVTDINADKAVGAKVLISQMIPCRARMIIQHGAINGPIAYQKWLDMNEAIAGNGATPITGVDYRITAHVALLNDGSGNLAPAYDIGDGIHENNAARQIIADAWEDGLIAMGVV